MPSLSNLEVASSSGNSYFSPPLIDRSILETKLLLKTITLARLLSSKSTLLRNVECSNSRYRLLLAAFLQVARALRIAEKTIGFTERYTEFLKLLSNFSLLQCLQLLKDARWSIIVQKKVMEHKLKKYFFKWRTSANGTKPLNRIKANFQSEILSKYRDDNYSDYKKGMALRPILKFDHPARDSFQKWRLFYRSKKVFECQKVEMQQKILGVWQKWTFLKLRYENYLSLPLTPIINDDKAVCRYVWGEWRATAKLQRYRIKDYSYCKRTILTKWKVAAEIWMERLKLSSLFDAARNVKPALVKWISARTSVQFYLDKARLHYRKNLLTESLTRWRLKRRRLLTINKAFGRWRSFAEFQRKRFNQAIIFDSQKKIIGFYQNWRREATRRRELYIMAKKFINKREMRSVALFFNVWKELRKWIKRSSEKVLTVRAAKDVRSCLRIWRGWLDQRRMSRSFYLVTLTKRTFMTWSSRAQNSHKSRLIKIKVLQGWRKLLMTKYTVCHYLILKSPPTMAHEVRQLMGSSTWPTLCNRTLALRYFNEWKGRAALCRQLDLYLTRRQMLQKFNVLKGWRMHINVESFLCQTPWKLKKRMFRRMRGKIVENFGKEQILEAKLADLLLSRDYVIYYRGFERWQQAFQSRKMEEHLCTQNLAYYNHQKRTIILQNWKLITCAKILDRYKALNEKKRIIQSWHKNTDGEILNRRNRALSRTLNAWRTGFRNSVAKDYIKTKNRLIAREMFVNWHLKSRRQRDTHNHSIEFIGTSMLRYYLQKWRTEGAVKRFQRVNKSRSIQLDYVKARPTRKVSFVDTPDQVVY